MRPADSIRMLNAAFARYLSRTIPMDVPRHFMDGTPIRTAEELAAAMELSVTEARYRMEKNLYADNGSHTVACGVGTVLERARTVSRPKRRRKKRRKDREQ